MSATALAHLPPPGPTELLFVLFHGAGHDAASMAPLVQRLVNEYPQAAVVSLDAPAPCDGGAGRQWFSSQDLTDETRVTRVADALPRFVGTVRAIQERLHMGWERTALVGFSQGAVMALEAVQAEPAFAGRVLAFSGRHATPPAHAPRDVTVHIFHGMADPETPPDLVIDAAERLVALDADVTADLLPGIGHELHPTLIDRAVEQLRGFLPKRVWRDAMSEAMSETPREPRTASSDERGT